MNYFAHAHRFLDRPWYVAGVSVPDWLGVVDRRCRVRRRTILEKLPQLEGDQRELALGILQHLDDDHWFHGTTAFFQLTGGIAALFRERAPADEAWRCGFLGHLTLELLIDAALIERQPDQLNRYYQILRELDPEQVEAGVGLLATKPPDRLALLIPRFLDERFLADYVNDAGLLHRINQVLRRVGLSPLGHEIQLVLAEARGLVRDRLDELLTAPVAESLEGSGSQSV